MAMLMHVYTNCVNIVNDIFIGNYFARLIKSRKYYHFDLLN